MQKSNDESVKYWARRPGVKKPPTLPCGRPVSERYCHLFSPLSVADALVVRGAIPLFSPRRNRTRGCRWPIRAYPSET